ncbi:MAG: LysM peptidoglycan-binding domain-containing protein [Lachnospiraceae bacterium]|nr:LysM peptidoglycan-binding domain-containing protein [Lachnospiraceae bacterium]
MEIYVVRAGDTVDSIALLYGISPEQLAYDNQIPYPYQLAVGQALLIRYNEETGSFPLVVNGYGYPFIDQQVLEATLPYLSELSVFSYGFTLEGQLLYPPVDDTRMLETAADFGVASILTLTPFDEQGNFNNNYIHVLVNNQEVIDRLLSELLAVMTEKGYAGLDIDFEFILAEDRVAFAEFVEKARIFMNENGFTVSVALAPKTSADQPGLLYEGKDYRLLGEAANSVLLMTYEWGYTYGPPMAVAPLPNVRQVVEYAITEIPVEKIDLGIPNYGYDWPLPFERGVTAATTIGNRQAVELAITYGAEILYDERSQAPYFFYWDGYGIQHEVWFEDVRSMLAKFNLIKEYNLRGCGYWQIMKLFRANWLLLEKEFYILS